MAYRDLFLKPLAETVDLAIALAQEAYDGEFGENAETAYQAEFVRLQGSTALALEEVDQIGAPKTAIGRLIERIQDWWWDRVSQPTIDLGEEDEAILETTFAFPVPLLRTHPLQDTPYEYDEIDCALDAATSEIIDGVSAQTAWVPISFQKPEPDDDFAFDPLDQVAAVWRKPTGTDLLVLVDQLEEDPKLMGYSFGLAHLVGKPAAVLAERLR